MRKAFYVAMGWLHLRKGICKNNFACHTERKIDQRKFNLSVVKSNGSICLFVIKIELLLLNVIFSDLTILDASK